MFLWKHSGHSLFSRMQSDLEQFFFFFIFFFSIHFLATKHVKIQQNKVNFSSYKLVTSSASSWAFSISLMIMLLFLRKLLIFSIHITMCWTRQMQLMMNRRILPTPVMIPMTSPGRMMKSMNSPSMYMRRTMKIRGNGFFWLLSPAYWAIMVLFGWVWEGYWSWTRFVVTAQLNLNWSWCLTLKWVGSHPPPTTRNF